MARTIIACELMLQLYKFVMIVFNYGKTGETNLDIYPVRDWRFDNILYLIKYKYKPHCRDKAIM